MKKVLAIGVMLLAVAFSVQRQVLAQAEDPKSPIVKSTLENNTAVPGQAVLYRLTVLVPTWMLKPPRFPNLEVPNVAVRLPSGASTPTSERVGAETWSGVSRLYRLHPMTSGTFHIPENTIEVTYSDPKSGQPIDINVATSAFEIIGQVPKGAESLNPFIAANSLVLKRTVDGDASALDIGGALKVTTEVSVKGVAPMFIAPQTLSDPPAGLRFYADEPVVQESEDRGLLSGSRTEVVTVFAEADGAYVLPEAAVSWYNLQTRTIETATVPDIAVTVTNSTPSKEQTVRGFSLAQSATLVVAGLFICISAGLGLKWIVPKVSKFIRQKSIQYQKTEVYAYFQLNAAIKAKDLPKVLLRLPAWQERLDMDIGPTDMRAVTCALARLGAQMYGVPSSTLSVTPEHDWALLKKTLSTSRQNYLKAGKPKSRRSLPALNPTS